MSPSSYLSTLLGGRVLVACQQYQQSQACGPWMSPSLYLLSHLDLRVNEWKVDRGKGEWSVESIGEWRLEIGEERCEVECGVE